MCPARGFSSVVAGLATVDEAVFDAVATSTSPVLDLTMPTLSRAADHSKLWLAIAAVLSRTGSPSMRRGAVRGVLTLAATSLLTNQVAKRMWVRPRPSQTRVPLIRRRRLPTSNSLPSGHSASAAAFAVGVGLESPGLGLPLGVLAGLVGLSRVATGVHYPGDVFAGFGLGAAVAVAGARLVPRIGPLDLRTPDPLRFDTSSRPGGEGVVLVVNPSSGDGTRDQLIDEVNTKLPAAEVIEVGENDDVESVLRSAAQRAQVLAVGGGDGTVSAAAAVALECGLPLAVFPAGTYNHFAKDVGCDTVQRTVEAIQTGSAAFVDVIRLNDAEIVINTASIGAYPKFVAMREKLERRLGKRLAAIYAMVHTLLKSDPVRIRFDNKELQTSLFFLGNSVYLPSGFAPARRSRMDDGLIDVRFLEAGRRLSRLRIVVSVALGRLERSPLYHETAVPEFAFESLDGPTAIARDGEISEPACSARFSAHYRALPVFQPLSR